MIRHRRPKSAGDFVSIVFAVLQQWIVFAILQQWIGLVDSQSTYGPYVDLEYPNQKLQSALLVQRDIALDIPISDILLPGINLTSSWFWTKEYAVENVTGISNLFDMGYRRFELDLWWNNATSSFQLCPEQIVSNTTSNATEVVTTTLTQAVTTTVSSTKTTLVTTVTSTFTSTVSSQPTADPDVPIPLANGFSCAPGANFPAVIDTLQVLLSRTDNLLRQAGLVLLILNLRTLPSLESNKTLDLSVSSSASLSLQINGSLGDWVYTPVALNKDRKNVNATFFSSNPQTDVSDYYQLDIANGTNIASTSNGWPSTRYLFSTQGRRLLIGFGTVDVSSKDYDITQDTSIIFPPATFGNQDTLISSTSIQNAAETCVGPIGQVFGPTGQLNFNSTNTTGNYTFAISTDPSSNALSYNTIESLVSCGLSPLIDSPLQNTNSGSSSPIGPIAASMWSWLPPSEPKNTSLPMNGTANVVACAALQADSGHWVVLDCNTELNVACRINNRISTWSIGPETNYFQATSVCPRGSSFSIPRTPQENRYLLSALRKTDVQSIWIDLNSLKAPDCWTVGNTNCPYGDSAAGLREQKVLVPIVASILVITVFTLMCLVKWQRYFQVRAARRRRRLVKGFLEYADYEGIPA